MWRVPSDCFVVKKSILPGAGSGLFSKDKIEKDTLFPVKHSPPRSKADPAEGYESMPIFLPSNVDMDSPCVVDGILTTLREAPIQNVKEQFVHARRSGCIMMMANDLAWKTNRSHRKYWGETKKNKLELILNFAENSVSVSIYANQHIGDGEEVGITYGYDYWTS